MVRLFKIYLDRAENRLSISTKVLILFWDLNCLFIRKKLNFLHCYDINIFSLLCLIICAFLTIEKHLILYSSFWNNFKIEGFYFVPTSIHISIYKFKLCVVQGSPTGLEQRSLVKGHAKLVHSAPAEVLHRENKVL